MEPVVYTVKVYDNRPEWYNSAGKLHRLNGPAKEYINGDDVIHREDGPAIEYVTRERYWYIKGVIYTEKEFKIKLNNCDLNSMAEVTKFLNYME